jgi:hypothetical protein
MKDTTNQNPGCIAGLLRLLGIGRPSRAAEEALPYRLSNRLLTEGEKPFYRVLRTVVADSAIICPKVNLADVFYVDTRSKNAIAHRNRIKQKHVDFLLCSPDSMQPVLGVELDDSSHKQAKRIERDEFVDEVFAAAGLPILHIPAKAGYNAQELAAALAPYIGLNGTQPVAHQPVPVPKSAAPAAAPLCPKCGIPMVVRTVSKGEKFGQQFYGCRNYPNCRQMLPI